MSQDHLIPDLLEFPKQSFANHLDLEDNHRIVFSAMFGMGKTTFLNHFFDEKTQESHYGYKKYNAVHLFPVNYSIATNEDIFSYLKYDIFYELALKHENQFLEYSMSYISTLDDFVRDNLDKILAPLLLLVPGVGRTGFQLFKQLNELKEKYLKFHTNQQTDKLDDAVKYIGTHQEREGSIYENNFYTELIHDVITRLKESEETTNNPVENVLILDDLDRIDPEHIFRLFNVFAAHFDSPQKNNRLNKFGFDKVILVCDINNIQNIFKNRYGTNVDFSGYIDKFFSREVFDFSNRETLDQLLKKLIQSYKYVWSNSQISSNELYEIIPSEDVRFILTQMIYSNAITLRTLIKGRFKEFPFDFRSIRFNQGISVPNTRARLVLQLEFLKKLFGSFDNLIIALEKCQGTSLSYQGNSHRLGEVIQLLDFTRNKLDILNNETSYHVVVDDYELTFTYNIIQEVSKESLTPLVSKVSYNEAKTGTIPYYSLLNQVAQLLREKKYFT